MYMRSLFGKVKRWICIGGGETICCLSSAPSVPISRRVSLLWNLLCRESRICFHCCMKQDTARASPWAFYCTKRCEKSTSTTVVLFRLRVEPVSTAAWKQLELMALSRDCVQVSSSCAFFLSFSYFLFWCCFVIVIATLCTGVHQLCFLFISFISLVLLLLLLLFVLFLLFVF